jgi:hypothetical protein
MIKAQYSGFNSSNFSPSSTPNTIIEVLYPLAISALGPKTVALQIPVEGYPVLGLIIC